MPVYAITLTHREGPGSPESRAASETVRRAGLDFGAVEMQTCYLLQGKFPHELAKRAADVLVDAVLESAAINVGTVQAPAAASGVTQIAVMRRAGVMDPVEASIKRAMTDAGISVSAVKRVHLYRVKRVLEGGDIRALARAFANETVDEYRVGEFTVERLATDHAYTFERVEAPILALDDDGLRRLNSANGLSMNIAELRAVQDYFKNVGREPTDIELDMLAQTWSEHCKHKTMTGPVHYSEAADDGEIEDSLFDIAPDILGQNGRIDGLLQGTIKRVTEELDREFCWSVFVDNAGVIEFDNEHGVCVKVETHNHPSAIEPYGGAGTGIGGVIRDILGTGLGAKPILNTDVFCFGPPDMPRDDVPKGALHPLTTLRGVVAGVRDYGNRMGIPTASGAIYFDERYTGNPLVYAGSIGLLPRDALIKGARTGDVIVAAGGRTGRDGVGGATFSSAELTQASETVSSGAVQIGNAIQEKVVLDVLLQARDQNLYNDITDCGAGGFSSAVGEMAHKTGARVELLKAPLKYQGLSYREIWLSEAQERMMFAVPRAKLDDFIALCASEDVETCVLGEFTGDGRMVVTYDDEVVLDLPMSFLHDGLPRVERSAVWAGPAKVRSGRHATRAREPQEILAAILAAPNVCSKEWVIRQYDHEVQAMSVVKPLTGVTNDGPSDACVTAPKPGSERALVVACGMNPRYGDIDPYWSAQAAIDEAVRNAVCVGGDVERLAILDNFSWGNCDKPDRLGGLVRSCVGCYVAARELRTPFISGKDSLNNEFATDTGTVAIPPTLLITAVSVTALDMICTMDLKRQGNVLYQIGATAPEFGGSHYNMVTGRADGRVPRYDARSALACYRALNRAQREKLIRSAHDCSEGGLAVALAEMAFAGGLGVDVQLSETLAGDPGLCDDTMLLFAESNARIVVEVAPEHEARLREIFIALPFARLGTVAASSRMRMTGLKGKTLIDSDINELRMIWKSPLYRAMGESVPSDVTAFAR